MENRKRGGQPKPAAERKRHNLTFRVRDQLRADLTAAAAANGRSLAQEIEHLLEYALLAQKTLGDLKEYERRARRSVDVQTGAAALPGSFLSEQQIKQLVRDTLREVLTPPKQQTDADLLREIEELRGRVDASMQKKRDDQDAA
jgi:hypothetical protein